MTNLDKTDESTMGTVTAEVEPEGWRPIETAQEEIIAGWWHAGVWMFRPACYDSGSLWKEQGFDSRSEAEGW